MKQIRKVKLKKYAEGDVTLTSWGDGLSNTQLGGIGAGAGLVGGGLQSLSGQGEDQNTGMAVAGGALSGAAAGMALGPIGAGVGALIGGAMSWISSDTNKYNAKKQREAREKAIAQAKADQAAQIAEQKRQIEQAKQSAAYTANINKSVNNASNVDQNDLKRPLTSVYKTGGIHDANPNAELESGEPYMTPDGKITNIPKTAPTHAEGGVKLNLPDGTKILGKNEIVDGVMFKEIGSKLGKAQNMYNKTLLENPTAIAKRTAERSLNNINNKYNALVKIQEQQKDLDTQTVFATGGTVKSIKAFNKKYGTNYVSLGDFTNYNKGEQYAGKDTDVLMNMVGDSARYGSNSGFNNVVDRFDKANMQRAINELKSGQKTYATGGCTYDGKRMDQPTKFNNGGIPKYWGGTDATKAQKYMYPAAGDNNYVNPMTQPKYTTSNATPSFLKEGATYAPINNTVPILQPNQVPTYTGVENVLGSNKDSIVSGNGSYSTGKYNVKPTVDETDKKPFNWDTAIDVGGAALGAAPLLYNIGKGLFDKPKQYKASDVYQSTYSPIQYDNPYEGQMLAEAEKDLNPNINIDPIVAEARTNRRIGNYAAKNAARSYAELMNAGVANQGAENKAVAEAYAYKHNLETQLKTAARSRKLGILSYLAKTRQTLAVNNAQMRQSDLMAQNAANQWALDATDRALGAKQNLISTGMGDLSNYVQNLLKMRNERRAIGTKDYDVQNGKASIRK